MFILPRTPRRGSFIPPCSRINQTSLNTGAVHFKVILNILQVKTSLSSDNPIQNADEKRNMHHTKVYL